MANTNSNLCSSNFVAPDFELLDTVSNKLLRLSELTGTKGTVITFICNHCPFVIHINPVLVQLANQFQKDGIGFIAISSNDVSKYPQDAPNLMKQVAIENQYPFPYLYDETQAIAKAYDAACTPDIFVFDKHLKIYYHGQLDDSRPGNQIPVTGNDLLNALEQLLLNQTYQGPQKPSMGCNIKWKE